MERQFLDLRDRLLRHGIAWRHAHQCALELSQHFEALRDQCLAQGHAPDQADRVAAGRLGDIGQCMQAMLNASHLRSRFATAPFCALVLGPAAIMIGVIFLGVSLLSMLCAVLSPVTAQTLGTVIAILFDDVLPVVCGWTVAIIAIRQRLPAFWPVFALCLLAVLGSMINIATIMPGAQLPGIVHFTVRVGSENFSRIVDDLLLTLMPYWTVTQWQELRRYHR